MTETTMKTLTLSVTWDPDNDCGLSPGYTPQSEEQYRVLKIGRLVLVWGMDA